jgi:ketosteroid isomerase-like protein
VIAAPPDGVDLKAFQAIEDRFNDAMVSNNVERIAQCISDDWVLVTPEKGPIGREVILQAISSGMLTHDSMTKQVVRAKVYGDMAVVTGRGSNTGTFRGAPISADEWVTDVYRFAQGQWRCVLTHLAAAD